MPAKKQITKFPSSATSDCARKKLRVGDLILASESNWSYMVIHISDEQSITFLSFKTLRLITVSTQFEFVTASDIIIHAA